MNIFWLSNNPEKCAAYHCDKHVVKMIVEYAQLLSTAVRLVDGNPITMGKRTFYLLKGERLEFNGLTPYIEAQVDVYLPTHMNHPCALWARENSSNWLALKALALALCAEYTKRYGKVHKCEALIRKLKLPSLPDAKRTPVPLTMPDEYKGGDPVTAYRKFYLGSKSRFAQWRYTKVPAWYQKGLSCSTK